MGILKHIRRVVAFVVLLLFVLMFVDFAGLIPVEVSGLMRVQFVPALLSGSWIIVLAILVSVLVLGRVYCSVLCPLGIMKDLVSILRRWFTRLRGERKRRLIFTKAHTLTGYVLMAAAFLPALFMGSSFVLLLLDPYSNFGRIAHSIFRPIYMWLNNLLAMGANALGNYSLYMVTPSIDVPSLVFVVVVFTIIVVMAWRRERWWCNTICPVGALFGLLSRHSFFRVKIDNSKCTSCSRCSSVCKSHCIDSKNKHVDGSRCVTCYNCLSVCDQAGVEYGFSVPWKGVKKETTMVSEDSNISAYRFDKSRRYFLASSVTTLTLIPFIGIAASLEKALLLRTVYPVPPGAVPEFSSLCTGCQLCVSRCPMGTLRPAFTERGLAGFMQPIMYFKPHCYCNYECTTCSEVCPTGALEPLTVEQKKLRQVGYVCFVISECVVETLGQDCGACAEHCPTGAVKMISDEYGYTFPSIEPEICIGCGACESICPVRPKAIFIEGNKIQREAKKPYIQEVEEIKVDDFGF